MANKSEDMYKYYVRAMKDVGYVGLPPTKSEKTARANIRALEKEVGKQYKFAVEKVKKASKKANK